MASWYSAVQRFSGVFRILLYDAPGQSRGSIVSGKAAVSVDEQVSTLRALTRALIGAREPLYLVGASWGAVIAAIYAARFSDDVSLLMLASFGLRPSAKMLQVIEAARGLFAVKKTHEGAELIIRTFGERLTNENKIKMIRQFQSLTREQLDSIYEHLKVIASSGSLNRYVDLRRVRARTVILNGAEDRLLDKEDLHLAARLIPHAELRIIPDAGHFLHLEREDILDIYAEYLTPGSGRAGLTASS